MSSINAAGWARLIDRTRAAGQELHSLIVTHRGQTIIRAFGQPWGAEHQQLLYSLSKTFTSAAVGLVVDDGLVGFDTRIVDIFPDQAGDGVGPKMAGLRVRDALAMASGHTSETYDWFADRNQRRPTRASIGQYLRLEPDGTPGVTFAYNQMNTWLCSRVVAEVSGLDVLELLRQRVFDPIGIGPATWGRDGDGLPLGFSGLHLRPDDVARFIALVAAGEVHQGQRLLGREWLDNFSHAWVETLDPAGEQTGDWSLGYGWQVWRGQHGFRGDGAFGQYGIIVPDHDLQVVVTGETDDIQTLLSALWEDVLPGLGEGSDTEGDSAALEQRLAGLGRPAGAPGAVQSWQGTWVDQPARLDVEGDRARFVFHDDAGEHALAVGLGEWRESVVRWGADSLTVATCLEQGPDGQQLVVCVVNSPHTFTLDLGSQQADLAWRLQPLHGPDPRGLAQAFGD